jgi:hypothetical protein
MPQRLCLLFASCFGEKIAPAKALRRYEVLKICRLQGSKNKILSYNLYGDLLSFFYPFGERR